MPSWPGTNGSVGLTGQSPCAAWRSVWHTPQASVLTRIWPAPGEGMSHSWNIKGLPNCSTTAACIVRAMGNVLLCPPRSLTIGRAVVLGRGVDRGDAHQLLVDEFLDAH